MYTPDKAPQLWINEVDVAPSHQRRGIGRKLLDLLLSHGVALGCTDGWLGTEETNVAALRLYESAGAAPEAFLLYMYPLQPADRDEAPRPDGPERGDNRSHA